MSTMRSSTVTVGEQIERLAVERAVVVLREQVRSLPVYHEDGLWVRTQVLRLLDQVMAPTARSGSDTSGGVPAAAKTVPDPEQTTAAAPTSAERRAAGTG